MNLRKEPLLFAGSLGIALLVLGGGDTQKVPTSAKPKSKDVPTVSMPVVVLADLAARVAPVEIFREPTEAIPLPPTELRFPRLGSLPIVAPPLPGGPIPGAYFLHRLPGIDPVAHEFTPRKEAVDASSNGGSSTPTTPQRGLTEAELAQRFDRVWQLPGSTMMWGLILNADKLSLRPTGPFNEPILFQHIHSSTGLKSGAPRTIEATKIDHIQLADSLENRIALKRRELSMAQESVAARIEFITMLIDEARKDPAIWVDAEREGQTLIEITKGELGYLEFLRVLRAEGDLGKELALYESLPEDLGDSAFRWREQGRLEARLGLDRDAEAHLRAAVQKQPLDARANDALANFLLARGRAIEALPYADQAARATSQALDGDSADHSVTLGRIQLALGRVADASATLDGARGASAGIEMLRGVLEYTLGNLDVASARFEREIEDSGDPVASYCLGAVRLRQGRFDDARDLFERVRDAAPTLRARALASLGLLYERTGHMDLATPALEEAERADPSDAWIVYMRGRLLRLSGDLDGSVTKLREARRLGDEFIEALAECGLALREKGLGDGDDAAESLARSARYFDRLVELDAKRSQLPLFVEIQGDILARLGDVSRARRAFESIIDKNSDFARFGLAILDYRQKRTNDARAALALLQNDASGARDTRDTAQQLIDLIDDNGSKEQVRDTFTREIVGQVWKVQGALAPSIKDGELLFKGNSGSIETETLVRRSLKRGGNFLRCEVSFTLHSIAPTPASAGLRIQNTAKGQDFDLEVGLFRERAGLLPEVRIHDGPPRGDEKQDPIRLEGLELDLMGRQTVAIELVPDADRSTHKFNLRIEWNGRVVHERAGLRAINENSSFELATELFCSGKPIEVGFDDYRLVRRRETK